MGNYRRDTAFFIGLFVMFWIIMILGVFPGTMMIGGSSFPYIFTLWVLLGGSILLPIIFIMFVLNSKKKNQQSLNVADWFLMSATTVYMILWAVIPPVGSLVNVGGYGYRTEYFFNWLTFGILVILIICIGIGYFILKKRQR